MNKDYRVKELVWPQGWPRTKPEDRERSRFKEKNSKGRMRPRSIHSSVTELRTEVNRLDGAKDLIISTDVPTRKDGLPYSNAAEPDDPGAVAYFTLDGEDRAIPNDRFDRVADNLYGIAKIIWAMRGIERWGTAKMIHAAFTGFQALPEKGSTNGKAWYEVLEVSPDATQNEIRTAYFKKAKTCHPDVKGGSTEKFNKLQNAFQQAIEAVKSNQK